MGVSQNKISYYKTAGASKFRRFGLLALAFVGLFLSWKLCLIDKIRDEVLYYGIESKIFFISTITNLKDKLDLFLKVSSGEFVNELELIRRENERLKSEFAILESIKLENSELKKMLRIKNMTYRYVVAKVIHKTSSDWNASVVADVGAWDGINEDDIVLNERGLVGKVIKVFEENCIILLTTDSNLNVPVYFSADGKKNDESVAILKGKDADKLVIYMKHFNFVPQIGEKVFSSGDGGIFPEGIQVGFVSDKGNIEPVFKLNQLTYVCIRINRKRGFWERKIPDYEKNFRRDLFFLNFIPIDIIDRYDLQKYSI